MEPSSESALVVDSFVELSAAVSFDDSVVVVFEESLSVFSESDSSDTITRRLTGFNPWFTACPRLPDAALNCFSGCAAEMTSACESLLKDTDSTKLGITDPIIKIETNIID